ncbi:MAG: transcriptional regulator [Myxococcales bacterium]|nr:transcriptional regulator [Myxococcales bacterium]
MTPEQCRAARALLRWTVQDLHKASGVAAHTISTFEARSAPDRKFRTATLTTLQLAFERAGIEFLGDGAPGVRLHAVSASAPRR